MRPDRPDCDECRELHENDPPCRECGKPPALSRKNGIAWATWLACNEYRPVDCYQGYPLQIPPADLEREAVKTDDPDAILDRMKRIEAHALKVRREEWSKKQKAKQRKRK